jgi:hypothetical protein
VLAIIPAIVGMVISIITVAKLVIDYRKSRIELSMLEQEANGPEA